MTFLMFKKNNILGQVKLHKILKKQITLCNFLVSSTRCKLTTNWVLQQKCRIKSGDGFLRIFTVPLLLSKAAGHFITLN